jgi:hypothetical protein
MSAGQAFWEPILCLATRHKHNGFHEEREVRMVVVVPDDESFSQERKAGNNRLRKREFFCIRNGMLVPRIAFFEKPDGARAALPIKKIIVGPHPEKMKRMESIKLLLSGLGIKADVTMSDIPYLGY